MSPQMYWDYIRLEVRVRASGEHLKTGNVPSDIQKSWHFFTYKSVVLSELHAFVSPRYQKRWILIQVRYVSKYAGSLIVYS